MQHGKYSLPLNLLWGLVVCLVFAGLSGCSAAVRLYPVQGPLAAVAPAPVYAGKLTVNKNFHSGTVTAVMDGGETFKSTLNLVQNNARKGAGSGEATPPMADDMKAGWDTIYGEGYFVAHVLGDGQYGRASFTGSKGTTLQMEIHSSVSVQGDHTEFSQPNGVAKDSKGNLYKVVVG